MRDRFWRIALTGVLCVALGGLALAPGLIFMPAAPESISVPAPPPRPVALPPPVETPPYDGQMRTSAQELDEQLAEITGPEALDCGHLDARATAKMIRAALACGLGAARSGRAFVVIKSESGVDSWVPHGLVGGRSGPLIRFSYDDHAGNFRTEPCPSPAVKWPSDRRYWRFSCAK